MDSSVWIAGILSNRGASAAILALAEQKELQIISSPDVFEETRRNLSEKYPLSVQHFLDLFGSIHPRLVQPSKKAILKAVKLINPNDAPILAAAMRAKPNFLITLDRKHFILPKISKDAGLEILIPAEFLRQYRRGK